MKVFGWEIARAKTSANGTEGWRTFDFTQVKDVDDATVEAFFDATHEKARRMPLLIAGWVAAEWEDRLTAPGTMDALAMAEVRGALKALRKFAGYYQNGIVAWGNKKAVRG